jgi:hypothetical protein
VARLRTKHLPHRITLQPIATETSESVEHSTPIPDVPAYVEQKSQLRVDRRSTSPTFGQEITSRTFVVVLTENDAEPRTRVTVWAGTPRERTSEVIDSALFDYKGTPNHVELYLE